MGSSAILEPGREVRDSGLIQHSFRVNNGQEHYFVVYRSGYG